MAGGTGPGGENAQIFALIAQVAGFIEPINQSIAKVADMAEKMATAFNSIQQSSGKAATKVTDDVKALDRSIGSIAAAKLQRSLAAGFKLDTNLLLGDFRGLKSKLAAELKKMEETASVEGKKIAKLLQSALETSTTGGQVLSVGREFAALTQLESGESKAVKSQVSKDDVASAREVAALRKQDAAFASKVNQEDIASAKEVAAILQKEATLLLQVHKDDLSSTREVVALRKQEEAFTAQVAKDDIASAKEVAGILKERFNLEKELDALIKQERQVQANSVAKEERALRAEIRDIVKQTAAIFKKLGTDEFSLIEDVREIKKDILTADKAGLELMIVEYRKALKSTQEEYKLQREIVASAKEMAAILKQDENKEKEIAQLKKEAIAAAKAGVRERLADERELANLIKSEAQATKSDARTAQVAARKAAADAHKAQIREISEEFAKLHGIIVKTAEAENLLAAKGQGVGASFRAGLEIAISRAGRLTGLLRQSAAEIGHISSTAVFVGGAIAASLVGAVNSSNSYVKSLQDISRETGLGFEETQRLIGAFRLYGVSADETGRALKILEQQLGKLREGDAAAEQKFRSLGISADQLANIHDAGELLNIVVDRLSKTKDSIEATNIGTELFGRNFVTMVRAVTGGADELKSKMAGISVVTDEQARAAAKVQESFESIKDQIQKTFVAITAAAKPSIDGIIEKIQGLIGWLNQLSDANKKAFVDGAIAVAGFALAFGAFGQIIGVAANLAALGINISTVTKFTAEFALKLGLVSGTLITSSGRVSAFSVLIGKLGSVLGGLTISAGIALAGLAALAVGFKLYVDQVQDNMDRLSEAAANTEQRAKALNTVLSHDIAGSSAAQLKELGITTGLLADAIGGANDAISELKSREGTLTNGEREHGNQLAELIPKLREAGVRLHDYAMEMEHTSEQIDQQLESSKAFVMQLNAETAALKDRIAAGKLKDPKEVNQAFDQQTAALAAQKFSGQQLELELRVRNARETTQKALASANRQQYEINKAQFQEELKLGLITNAAQLDDYKKTQSELINFADLGASYQKKLALEVVGFEQQVNQQRISDENLTVEKINQVRLHGLKQLQTQEEEALTAAKEAKIKGLTDAQKSVEERAALGGITKGEADRLRLEDGEARLKVEEAYSAKVIAVRQQYTDLGTALLKKSLKDAQDAENNAFHELEGLQKRKAGGANISSDEIDKSRAQVIKYRGLRIAIEDSLTKELADFDKMKLESTKDTEEKKYQLILKRAEFEAATNKALASDQTALDKFRVGISTDVFEKTSEQNQERIDQFDNLANQYISDIQRMSNAEDRRKAGIDAVTKLLEVQGQVAAKNAQALSETAESQFSKLFGFLKSQGLLTVSTLEDMRDQVAKSIEDTVAQQGPEAALNDELQKRIGILKEIDDQINLMNGDSGKATLTFKQMMQSFTPGTTYTPAGKDQFKAEKFDIPDLIGGVNSAANTIKNAFSGANTTGLLKQLEGVFTGPNNVIASSSSKVADSLQRLITQADALSTAFGKVINSVGGSQPDISKVINSGNSSQPKLNQPGAYYDDTKSEAENRRLQNIRDYDKKQSSTGGGNTTITINVPVYGAIGGKTQDLASKLVASLHESGMLDAGPSLNTVDTHFG